MAEQHWSRKNGWSRPLHPLQVLSWALTGALTSLAFGVILPGFLWVSLKSVLAALTIPSLIAAILLQILLTTTNPIDNAVTHGPQLSALHVASTEGCAIDADRNCHLCLVKVEQSSKHCRQCNKCVARFDHHCKWLNNCIGRKNYRMFMCYLCSIVLSCALVFGSSIALLVFHAQDSNGVAMTGFGLLTPPSLWIALVSAACALSFLIGFLALQLSIFHIRLIQRGQTTYTYILAARERGEPDPCVDLLKCRKTRPLQNPDQNTAPNDFEKGYASAGVYIGSPRPPFLVSHTKPTDIQLQNDFDDTRQLFSLNPVVRPVDKTASLSEPVAARKLTAGFTSVKIHPAMTTPPPINTVT